MDDHSRKMYLLPTKTCQLAKWIDTNGVHLAKGLLCQIGRLNFFKIHEKVGGVGRRKL